MKNKESKIKTNFEQLNFSTGKSYSQSEVGASYVAENEIEVIRGTGEVLVYRKNQRLE